MFGLQYSRRDLLRSSVGLTALTLPTFLQARATAAVAPKAKACIVIYCWGGISHYESWDPKPQAPVDLRGEFMPISTNVPGINFCEHLPLMARQADKMAIIRSVNHSDGGHGPALYTNMTGEKGAVGKAQDRSNRPSLMAMISQFCQPPPGTPKAVRMPHSMYDNGTLIPGQFGGWLGPNFDPILIPTPAGKPFGGTSRASGRELSLKRTLSRDRLVERQSLREWLDRGNASLSEYERLDQFQQMAADMLLDSAISRAYDLDREDSRVRGMYGNHIGGQSMLLARRLTEAGVPVVQVCAGAGDLAGGSGDNWDTHRDHFTKMKTRLLPVFDRSVSALLADLHMRGQLEETLVICLTDFGRTPKVNNNGGRDHYPAVYSVFMAGGGIRGGQVYGSSDPSGQKPASNPCSPADLHATVYRAMGIDPHAELHDSMGRPFPICLGQPLPLF